MLSLVYMLIFLAAGSIAGPCKPRTSSASPAPSPSSSKGPCKPKTSSASLAPPLSTGTSSGGTSGAASKVAKQPSGGSTLSLPHNNGTLPPSTLSGGSCPSGFINTVFNTNAGKNGGWPSTTWSSLTSNGVNDWIGFSLDTLDKKDTYGNCATTPALNAAQIHIVMDPRDSAAGIQMVQGANPPQYLELFNEPDFSFQGLTPLTDAITAAKSLAGFFTIQHPQTTYISPALMNANSDWLTTFKSNCNGCFDQIPIIAMHIYNPDVDGVMAQITQLHGTWPDKKIWITELSPATSGCTMDATAIGTYMQTLFQKIMALGYVEKIFWNSGEWDSPAINGAPDSCNPALTDTSGNPTPVLTALKNSCGGSGGTATS